MDKTCIRCYHFNPCVKCSENNVGVCDFGDCDLHKHRAVDGNCTVCDDYCEYRVADDPKWAVGVDLSSMSDCSVEMDYTIDADGKLILHSFSITRPEV